MDITKRLSELDPTLVLHNEGDWQNPLDPNKPGYTSFNDAGICTEDGEFLYAMVRILKPDFVLETGTHIGVGASYMGQALKDNKKGHLDTIEFLEPLYTQAQTRIEKMDLRDQVTCLFGDANTYSPAMTTYKLILLDTEPQTRFAELLKFFPSLEAGGFVFIHDLHQHMGQTGFNPDHPNDKFWPWGELPEAVKQLVREDKLRPFHFETPRGLTGFYKPHPDDYNWNSQAGPVA